MKHRRSVNIILLMLLTAVIGVSSCSDNIWDEMPASVSSFIAQYFPGEGISSYSEEDDSYYVKIRNNASLRFDENYEWTEIDGCGSALPPDLVLDQFPTDLYGYLESVEQQTQVYKVTRTRTVYEVVLENSEITYDIQTRTVTYDNAGHIQ